MGTGEKFAWGFILLVTILHFDLWNWDTTEVVFGFLPVGLAWQAGISLAAAAGWAILMAVGWPNEIEDWASQPSEIGDHCDRTEDPRP